jgi:hypothetical protein
MRTIVTESRVKGGTHPKMLKAKIAAALYHENGKVPTPEEIDKWTKFAQVLYTAVLGLHFEREQQKKDGQLAIF